MVTRDVLVASGNPGKLAMFQEWFARRGIVVHPVDPGNAEEQAEVGYKTAVQAKVDTIDVGRCRNRLILAHDSGFEYDSLDGQPGPRTKEWIRARGWETTPPRLGSGVRVVHAIAARIDDRCATFLASDHRVVASIPTADGNLPLTSTVEGPVNAFDAALTRAYAWATS